MRQGRPYFSRKSQEAPGSPATSRGGFDAVLIYPPWTVQEKRGRLMNSLPPLGLLSIAAYLRREGFSVALIDVFAERLGPSELRRRLRRLAPRFVGVSVLSPMETCALSIARIAKEAAPASTVVMGGVHAELYPERMLTHGAVDLVVRGDGEGPMSRIVSGMPWEEIESVSFRKADGGVLHTPMQPLETDLDAYPIPAYELVDPSRYSPSATSYAQLPAMNVMMTRGCPGACSFCNSARTRLRSHSPQRVLETIELLRERHSIRQVQFFDDTFTAKRRNLLELCRLLEEKRWGITFSCYARADTFDEEIASALERAGCHQVMIGIESGSPEIMRSIEKPISKERYERLVRLAHAHGMEVRAGFMMGSPGETKRTLEESLRFALALDVDFLQLSVCTPYPGTAIFRSALEEGRLAHLDFERYGQGEPIIRLDELTSEELLSIERRAWRAFYARPSMVARQLGRATSRRHLLDLIEAFRLLILNRGIRADPAIEQWRKETAPDRAHLAAVQDSLAIESSMGRPPLAPLTYEVRSAGTPRRAKERARQT